MEFPRRPGREGWERERRRRTENRCDGGKTLNLYLIHAVAGMQPRRRSHISSHAHSHKVSLTHVWPRVHAWLCTHTRSCCSKPIIQSESVHKFPSLVAACPMKVRTLFLSMPAIWQSPTCSICVCARPFLFILLHSSSARCSYLHFMLLLFSLFLPATFLWFIHLPISALTGGSFFLCLSSFLFFSFCLFLYWLWWLYNFLQSYQTSTHWEYPFFPLFFHRCCLTCSNTRRGVKVQH